MNESDNTVELSVVIAHHTVDDALLMSLEAHLAELAPSDEVVVVVADGNELGELRERFGRAELVSGAPSELTPQLWKRGIDRSRGSIVRVTIGSFVPKSGWRTALMAAHETADVVGGPMDMGRELRCSDLAIFFQRYRSFRSPLTARDVADVPADHSGYRASVLEETKEFWCDGFWERDVNAELARRGRRLALDPKFGATYVGGESAPKFIAHRFRHGIQFGRQRLASRGALVRIAYVAAFLIPGAVFSLKIVRESLAVPKTGPKLFAASGWLSLFVLAWSLGEWVGAVAGPEK